MTLRFLTLSAVAGIAFGVGAIGAQAETLRLSSFEPPVAHVTKNIITPWAEDVRRESNGEVDIQIFAGGTLGRSPAQQLKLVEDGVADIAWVIPGYTPGRFDSGTVAELPFLVDTSAQGSKAMWNMYAKGYFKGDYDKFKLLCVCVSHSNYVAADRAIASPDDMNGVKMRAPGPVALKAIEKAGAVPVGGITGPTVAESLNRGLIDGLFTQWGAVETFKMGSELSHYTLVPVGATPFLILMNKQKYESLSDAGKAVIDKYSGAAFSERFGALFDSNVFEARERTMAAHAPEIIEPDEASMLKWRDALSVATDEWIAGHENGQEIYDAFVKELAAAK